MNGITREDMTCRELVELVTAYIEDALDPDDRAVFADHLAICKNCTTYVEQIRLTILAAGEVTEDTLDPAARDGLMRAFRGWQRRGDGAG
jgi:anti-sigma factor RsiW